MPGDGFLLLTEKLPLVGIAVLAGAALLFAFGMQTPDEMIRTSVRRSVALIDDDPDVRLALRSLIESRTAFRVVGEAHNGAEGLAVVDAVCPDIVVMDVKLAEVDGIEATRRIIQRHPYIRVVGFSSPDDDPTGEIMRRAGASNFMVKGDSPDHIIDTLLELVA